MKESTRPSVYYHHHHLTFSVLITTTEWSGGGQLYYFLFPKPLVLKAVSIKKGDMADT